MLIKKSFFAVFGLIILSNKIYADLLTESPFNFGKIAVLSNASISSVQMSRTGRAAATGSIHILEIGQPGVYTLSGFPPYSIVRMTAQVPAFSASPIPGTQQFNISAVDMQDTVNIDASGTAQFKLGGVLQTSGVGGTYIGPATYQIMLDINIIY
jgi:hypothetical protein